MNKTIFQIDYKISVIIICVLGIISGFVSNAYTVNGVVSFIFHFIKIGVLTLIYLALYLIENKNKQFKEKLKYLFGDLAILNLMNIVFAIFISTHILPQLFLTMSGIISLYIVVSFSFEIVTLYYKNEIIGKITEFNKKIGNAIANPIVNLIDNITND
ncbi:MAG: hypothetical protein IKJ30_04545 [Bacilli bacterium]|nr:hypothetical protein [Bacilli bacterium]